MTLGTFSGFGRDPVDPDFVAFKEGLIGAVKDPNDQLRWRWSPKHRHWYEYPASTWVLEDLNLPDTSPGDAVKQHPSWPNSTYEVQEFYIVPLWNALELNWAKLSRSYPNLYLVWSPWGNGDWRNVLDRTKTPPPAPTPVDPKPNLSQRALEEIRQIQEWRARGLVSADKAQQMINDVIAKSLPDA